MDQKKINLDKTISGKDVLSIIDKKSECLEDKSTVVVTVPAVKNVFHHGPPTLHPTK